MSIALIEQLGNDVLAAITKDCLIRYERNEEGCGFVLNNGQVHYCRNGAQNPEVDFSIYPTEYAKWEPDIQAIYHSHINGNRHFTDADALLCKRSNKPLILYDVQHSQFSAIDPSGNAPLLGRDFVYGIYDCWSLVRDWYWQNRNISLKDIDRAGESIASGDRFIWESPDWNTIGDNWGQFGFRGVSSLKEGDVLAMSFGANNTNVNHLGIYLGGDRFVHQLVNRKSCEEVWGDPWAGYTIAFWRHESA